MNNYEEIIEKIEDILDEGKPSFGGGGKIKVDGDAIRQCLEDLSAAIPTESTQARKIVAERREILYSAQENANKIVHDAELKAAELTQEHEITRNANNAAVKIIDKANDEANEILAKAKADADACRAEAERWSYNLRQSTYTGLIDILNECGSFLDNDIEQYNRSLAFFTQSREQVNTAVSRLENIVLKKPDDGE